MSLPVYRRPRAIDDLVEIGRHIAQDSPSAARNVLLAVERTLDTLSAFPLAGARCSTTDAALQGLRAAPVAGYPMYRVFYLVRETHLDVIRVLHTAREAGPLLHPEP